MLIGNSGFQGQVNVLGPQRIAESQATDAKNALIQSGDLVPFRTPLAQVSTGITPTGNDTIFLHASRWVTWPTPVKVVRAPSSNDAKRRLYFSDGTNFRVTDQDIIGGGYGPPAASRRVGLPVPTLADPAYTQQGTGTVTSVFIYATDKKDNKFLPKVSCTAPHKLKPNDSVVLDVPGFSAQGAFTVVITSDCSDSEFRIRGFKLKKAAFSGVVKPKDDSTNTGQLVTVQSQNHPFNDQDIVILHWKNTTASFTWASKNTPYTVVYQDTGHYQLSGTDSSSTAKHTLSGGGQQVGLCIQDASDPFYGPNSYGDISNYPNFAWDSTNKCYTITAFADSSSNMTSWTKTDIVSLLRDRVYVATFVNYYGEEGPPSDPTSDLVLTQGTAVTFATTPATSLSGSTDYNIQSVRLYRTDSSGNYRLVPKTDSEGALVKDSNGNVIYDIPYGTTNFVDKAVDSQLAESLPTIGWYQPPTNLQGIILFGGCIVGFVDKTVYACVPYIPSAFPLEYQLNTEYPIVGLVNTAAGIIVLTQGTPALIIGTDPANWGIVKLESAQACVSARSIVDMGDYAMYASPFGLVGIQQNQATVPTENVFSRLQWQDYAPGNIKASFYEGKYFGSNGSKSFVFNPSTGDFMPLDMVFSAFYNDLSTDTLYVLQSNGVIAAWDRGTGYQSYSWTGKIFQMPYPCNLGAAQVIFEPVSGTSSTFMLYADGVLKHTQAVTDNNPFRLPGGYLALTYQLKITGTARIKKMAAANTVSELRAV